MEEWKDIKGYEGLYRISNTGKVLSLRYMNSYNSKELTPKKNNKGYLWVELRNGGNPKQFLIHRLVAETFIENPNNYPIINHKDENPLNNDVSNLEWCTLSYNAKYSIDRHPNRYLNRVYSNRKKCKETNVEKRRVEGNPYKLVRAVNQFDVNNNVICTFKNIATIVREKGYHNTSIKECCEHKRKTAYGYRWEYAN